MIYKTYGQTGKQVSAVGFGGMRFDTKQPREKNAELLRYAFDQGITYFDTAPDYCQNQSEDIFGLALQQMKKDRDKFYVSTKGMPHALNTVAKTRQAVEKSLRRLNLDKIDFYFVWCIRKIEHYQQAMLPGGEYEGLLRCKEDGLIDHIVISTHLPADGVKLILQKREFDGVLLGVNILNFPYRWEGVQYAHELGLGVLAMNPLGGGVIPQHADKLSFLAAGGESPVEAALRFCISCPEITVTLSGFTTKEHIDTACHVADNCRPFTREEFDRIRRQVASGMNELCTGCGYCLEHCPQHIPIASYLLYYNEMLIADKSEKDMIADLATQRQWGVLAQRAADAGDCIRCGECEDVCTQHLNIIERLAQIARWEKQLSEISD